MKIAFHSNQLSLRGTETALFDYAHFNETLLNNKSVVVSPAHAPNHDQGALEKFAGRFPVFLYHSKQELESILQEEQADVLYCIKAGNNDGLASQIVRTVVHSVFAYNEPHGAVYAYVSEWLARHASAGEHPYVPHIVHLPDCNENLRSALGIPGDALVFGRHGGEDTFNIPYVHEAVSQLVQARDDFYFLFMNTQQFCAPHPHILHLPGSADPLQKTRFINTCDAMLHARESGETFGLAIAEFSIRDKPVVTCGIAREASHLELLGSKGLYYRSPSELVDLLWNFQPAPECRWDVYSQHFSPPQVMKQFQAVFL